MLKAFQGKNFIMIGS